MAAGMTEVAARAAAVHEQSGIGRQAELRRQCHGALGDFELSPGIAQAAC